MAQIPNINRGYQVLVRTGKPVGEPAYWSEYELRYFAEWANPYILCVREIFKDRSKKSGKRVGRFHLIKGFDDFDLAMGQLTKDLKKEIEYLDRIKNE